MQTNAISRSQPHIGCIQLSIQIPIAVWISRRIIQEAVDQAHGACQALQDFTVPLETEGEYWARSDMAPPRHAPKPTVKRPVQWKYGDEICVIPFGGSLRVCATTAKRALCHVQHVDGELHCQALRERYSCN